MKQNIIVRLKSRIMLDRKAFIIYSILRILVILTAVRSIFAGNYESFAFCILSLALFLVPSFLEGWLHVRIPTVLQIFIYCFIFAAEILGEINHFYTAIPGWDTMLHTINGFLCAAIGVSLIEILNRGSKNLQLSPFYVALMGFCFSMTIGVLWEFFEFSMDTFFHMDTQKDFIVNSISSVTLDPDNSQKAIWLKDIVKTTIETADGQTVVVNGYLDIGIIDTMKDLMVNFIGAVVFSVFGYVHEVKNKENRLNDRLLIKPLTDEEMEAQNQRIEDNLQRISVKAEERTTRKLRRKQEAK